MDRIPGSTGVMILVEPRRSGVTIIVVPFYRVLHEDYLFTDSLATILKLQQLDIQLHRVV